MVLDGDASDCIPETRRSLPGREGACAREIDETVVAVAADGDHEHARLHSFARENEAAADAAHALREPMLDCIGDRAFGLLDVSAGRRRSTARRKRWADRLVLGIESLAACHDPCTRSVAAHALSAWQVLARKRCRRSTGCLVRNGNVDIEMVSGPRHRFTEDRPARLFEIEERQVADEGRNLSIATGPLTTDGHFETARRHRRP